MFKKIVRVLMDINKAFTCGELLRRGMPAESVTTEWKRIDEHNRREAERWAEI